MIGEDWARASANQLGVFLAGEGIATPDERGQRVVDSSFYLMFNAHGEPALFRLPESRWGAQWRLVLDTTRGFVDDTESITLEAGKDYELASHALAVWMR
jgi:glycogen operon protein